jgi:hypothetical protein
MPRGSVALTNNFRSNPEVASSEAGRLSRSEGGYTHNPASAFLNGWWTFALLALNHGEERCVRSTDRHSNKRHDADASKLGYARNSCVEGYSFGAPCSDFVTARDSQLTD